MRPKMLQPPVLTLIVLVVAAVAAVRADCAELVSNEKGFAVTFPGPHTMTAQAAPEGALSMTQFVSELKTQGYVVVLVDWVALNPDADQLLDAQRDALLAQPGGKLLAERYFALGGRPGREVRFNSAMGVVVSRLIVDQVGKRTFNVLTGGPPPLDEKSVAAFLDSFRFLSNQEPKVDRQEAAFSITFPGPVTAVTQATEHGPMLQAQATTEGVDFMMAVLDSKTRLDGDPELRLGNARDSAIERLRGGMLVSERKITQGGRPGREFEITAVNDLAGWNHFFLDAKQDRLYMLVVVGRKQRLDPAKIAAFFDSFKLAEK